MCVVDELGMRIDIATDVALNVLTKRPLALSLLSSDGRSIASAAAAAAGIAAAERRGDTRRNGRWM